MGANFRPMTRADYNELGGYIKTATYSDAYDSLDMSLDSQALFGSDYKDDIYVSLERQNRRAAIALVLPTFNYVLSRSGAKLLQKILGISTGLWTGITNMSLVMEAETKNFVDLNSTNASTKYLFGAQIAEEYIKQFNVESAIKDELLKIVMSCLRDGSHVADDIDSFVSIVTEETDIPLCAGYYVELKNITTLQFVEEFKRGHRYPEYLHEQIVDKVFAGADSRLTYLLNIPKDKSTLFGMLNYNIAVVPSELRPKTMNKAHRLTERYVSVINANNELKSLLAEHALPRDIQVKYSALDQATSRLQYKSVGLNLTSIPLDDKSIIERLKGKEGQVRHNNLGKRQDYSGRAVVAINPYLPLDMIKVPKDMLPSLYEYHLLPYLAGNVTVHNKEVAQDLAPSDTTYNKLRLTNLSHPDAQQEMLRLLKEKQILQKVPAVLGRQPTLHKGSLQAFHVLPTDSQAIEVNPLVCPAFNMDFDGDQGYLKIPLSDGAVKEVRDLMLTTHNLYLPKTGECTIVPRQEMLYGLYQATRADYEVGTAERFYKSLSDVRVSLIRHEIKCSDTVSVPNHANILAGEAAFISCFPEGMVVPRNVTPGANQLQVCEITSKTIGKFIDRLLLKDADGNTLIPLGSGYASTETFVGAINTLVMLGFKLARLYAPSMSLLNKKENVPAFDNAIPTFHKNMEDIDFLYSVGFETSDNYKLSFDSELDKIAKSVESSMYEKLGKDNGYSLLALSGARGNLSNLTQIFAYKGRVKKNSSESFDALIENSYATQLAPVEHFIAAYGGRQGQIDKSLNTGNTGYAMRLMWHTTQGLSITCEDCGTQDGFEISKSFLSTLSTEEDSAKRQKDAEDTFKHAIIGRYRVGDAKPISEQEADKLAHDASIDAVKIRSPLYCKNPCCVKCYGIDWSTHRKAIVGLPVGLIAAHSIGEPGTQLTMKQFQKGGVAGKADLTSAFTKVECYLKCVDIASKSTHGTYAGYDPVAWETGDVRTEPTSDPEVKKIYIGDSTRSIKVPASLEVIEHATKGQGLSFHHGDYYVAELLKYCGIEAAQRYLTFKLFSLYKSECKIATVHFEVLVSCMTRHMVIATDRKDLRVGQYHTTQELHSGDLSHTEYVSRILSVQDIPSVSNEAFDTIDLEDPVYGLSRACALKLEDSLTKPINRMVLGQTIKDGSRVDGFVEKRRGEY